MAGLQRFITYINKYENDEKKENAGFAKIEIRGTVCRVEVHIRNISIEQPKATVYLYAREQEIIQAIPVGNIEISRGNGDVRYAFDTKELLNFGKTIKDMEGIFITFGEIENADMSSGDSRENLFLASQWKEGVINKRAFHILEKMKPQENPAQMTDESRNQTNDSPVPDTQQEVLQSGNNRREGWRANNRQDILRARNSMPEAVKPGDSMPEAVKPGNTMQEAVQPENNVQGTMPSENTRQESEQPENPQQETAQTENIRQESMPPENPQQESSQTETIRQESLQAEQLQQDILQQDPSNALNELQGSENGQTQAANMSNIPFPRRRGPFRGRRNIRATELPMEEFFEDAGWERMFQKLRLKLDIVFPFEGQEIECVRMQLNDLQEFPKKYWYLGNNSFLLHGFFNYRHIIFGERRNEEEKEYFIGVPGVFQNQERIMAAMFGFPEFCTAKNTEYKTGNFGYWYRIL